MYLHIYIYTPQETLFLVVQLNNLSMRYTYLEVAIESYMSGI